MPRVLVIDDQRIPRMAVAGMLEEARYDVDTAQSGPAGLDAAREQAPDVIVLDVYMPDMDGFEVVRRLKQDPATEPIPVVFLTAERPSDELIVRGLEAGAYDFLSKDCSRAELLARVAVMSRIKRAHDEMAALARISDTLIQTLDPDAMSQLFVDQTCDVFRAAGALLWQRGGEEAREVAAAANLPGERDAWRGVASDIHAWLDGAGTHGDLTPVEALEPGTRDFLRQQGVTTVLAAVVRSESATPTLLVVFGDGARGFRRESDRRLLESLARQARIALDNAVLHETKHLQAEELERAMSIRSRFFASMSHELRTPINALIGYNQLLQQGMFGELSERQQQAVENIARASNHLLDLINDVLDISKIEAGKIEVSPEATDVVELLTDTLTSIRPQAKEKQLELRVEVPDSVPLVTDPARVRQILLNLVSNAVKFTDDGFVRVRVEEADQQVRISVTDTGPGIAPEHQERIFEEFEQVPTAVSRGGTGLGLPISKRLADLLGGTLEMESGPGEGSTFTLVLPAARKISEQRESREPGIAPRAG